MISLYETCSTFEYKYYSYHQSTMAAASECVPEDKTNQIAVKDGANVIIKCASCRAMVPASEICGYYVNSTNPGVPCTLHDLTILFYRSNVGDRGLFRRSDVGNGAVTLRSLTTTEACAIWTLLDSLMSSGFFG